MYFHRLGEIEYEAYEMVQQYDAVHKEFDRCVKDHVNSAEVFNKLYRPGLTKSVFIGNLKEIIEPVYLAASNMGFELWRLP